jgi:hypothetical protein
MKGARLALRFDTFGVLANELPPNCHVLVRSYVGDWCFGLVAEPRFRALYLASPWGFWKLDTSQLVATFADEVQEWKRGDDVARGRSLTGRIVPITRWLVAPPALVSRLQGQTPRARQRAPRRRRK